MLPGDPLQLLKELKGRHDVATFPLDGLKDNGGNFIRAEDHYKLAIKFAPEYPAAYYNYCYCLSALRKYDELEAILELAIKVPGVSYATVYNEYGLLREIQGKLDDAIHYFKLHIKNSFDAKSIETASDSIKRCERKKQLA